MWLRLDIDWAEHPKVLAAGDEAAQLYIRLLARAAKWRTDGRVPLHDIRREQRAALERLVTVGLIDRAADGELTIHDFLDYQPSAAEWAEREKRLSEAGRIGANARWHGKPHATSNAITMPREREHLSLRERGSGGERAARGTRVPSPFTVDEPMRAWAKKNAPGVDVDKATESFMDYWRATPGMKGLKLDWTATWRNWLRNTR